MVEESTLTRGGIMGAIARNGDEINSSTASDHIRTRKWISSPTEENPDDGYYDYRYISATVTGNIQSTSGSVYANGILVSTKGDATNESDSYSLPSGYSYVSGSHSNTTGSISGSSSTVYIGGKPVARKGDSVTTHAGHSTTINGGSPNVFAN